MWADVEVFTAKYPDFQLEDELLLDGGRDVMWGRTYSRKRRARDVRRAPEQSSTGAAFTTAGASAGLGLGSG